MNSEPEKSYDDLIAALHSTPDLDDGIVTTYIRLWQLETWLRRMVYVELRARYGDSWSSKIQFHPSHLAKDKVLTHMVTPETTAISYADFSSLCNAIVDEWELFKSYLPKQNIWEARIEEIKQIRNRVAHFRTSHPDDLNRVTQLLRDIDEGIWRFCTSLNNTYSSFSPSNDSTDPVIYEFAYLIPYSPSATVEYAGGAPLKHFESSLELSIRVNRRPWESNNPPPPIVEVAGFIYDVDIHALRNRRFKSDMFLESTKGIHSSVVYIILDAGEDIIRVLLPAVLGKERLVALIEMFVQAAASALTSVYRPENTDFTDWSFKERDRIQRIADRWPEYVIGPIDPIAFLDPDMPCSMFRA